MPLLDRQYFLLPLHRFRGIPGVTREQLHTLAQLFVEITDPAVSERTVHLQVYTDNDLYDATFRAMLGGMHAMFRMPVEAGPQPDAGRAGIPAFRLLETDRAAPRAGGRRHRTRPAPHRCPAGRADTHCRGARVAAADAPGTRPLVAANARPFELREILRILGRRDGRRTTFLPVPWRIERLALRGAEALGLRMRLRSDSLVSLMNQDHAPDFAPSAAYAFRDFEHATLGASPT